MDVPSLWDAARNGQRTLIITTVVMIAAVVATTVFVVANAGAEPVSFTADVDTQAAANAVEVKVTGCAAGVEAPAEVSGEWRSDEGDVPLEAFVVVFPAGRCVTARVTGDVPPVMAYTSAGNPGLAWTLVGSVTPLVPGMDAVPFAVDPVELEYD